MANKIMSKNRDLHEKIAEALLVQEEMTKEEFDTFFDNVSVPAKIIM